MTDHRLMTDELQRQLGHWLGAASTFQDAEQFASRAAWESVERAIGLPVRRQLATTVEQMLQTGRTAAATVRASRTDPAMLGEAHRQVQQFRRLYVQVETTLDFFGQAVNTRTGETLRVALQFLDHVAYQSMAQALQPVGLPVPPVLTYLGEGLGASILRAGIRLWAPGVVNPVAAIKIVRHNLYRPTSLFHETGHQVAHLTGWTEVLGEALGIALADDPQLRSMWQPWASEIAADVFAFAHTGFASVSALYDVVGDERTILRWPLGDPHPVGLLRTQLGCAMARRSYGAGPWDALEQAAIVAHPITRADESAAPLLVRSQQRMAEIAKVCVETKVPGFRDRPIAALVDPQRVSPSALGDLERQGGRSLWTSPHWRNTEGIRLVALAGLREAERPDRAAEWIDRARSWITGSALAA